MRLSKKQRIFDLEEKVEFLMNARRHMQRTLDTNDALLKILKQRVSLLEDSAGCNRAEKVPPEPKCQLHGEAHEWEA